MIGVEPGSGVWPGLRIKASLGASSLAGRLRAESTRRETSCLDRFLTCFFFRSRGMLFLSATDTLTVRKIPMTKRC